ncbi:hypothetical protein PMI06_005604 [Burkholderia sp. BT03]|nr:hypothetical protein PMI06_005604 [Burkholderia sp. BT03]
MSAFLNLFVHFRIYDWIACTVEFKRCDGMLNRPSLLLGMIAPRSNYIFSYRISQLPRSYLASALIDKLARHRHVRRVQCPALAAAIDLLVAQQVRSNLVGRAGVADDARENYLNCHVNLATLLPQLSPGPGEVYGAAPEIPLYFPLPPISV